MSYVYGDVDEDGTFKDPSNNADAFSVIER